MASTSADAGTTRIQRTVTGFPRIGEHRELKKALEAYWAGKTDANVLADLGRELRLRHWKQQSGLDWISVNDFSYYDAMLDTAVAFGIIPRRYRSIPAGFERYFAMARGSKDLHALSMKKWFNTNYHYIVPELDADQDFSRDFSQVLGAVEEALSAGYSAKRLKINLIGPLTFLRLSRFSTTDVSETQGDTLELLPRLLPAYSDLVQALAAAAPGAILQFEEPILVRDPDQVLLAALESAYRTLCADNPEARLVLSTYFDHALEALPILKALPLWGIGLDLVHGLKNLEGLAPWGKQRLFAGIVNGRNVWAHDIDAGLAVLGQAASAVGGDRIVLSTSCSLLHVPYNAGAETGLPEAVRAKLAFATEKLAELERLADLFEKSGGGQSEHPHAADAAGKTSSAETASPETATTSRGVSVRERLGIQRKALDLPLLPTTTIGSFPQTITLRELRKDFRDRRIDRAAYENGLKAQIAECIAFQENIGLDILVHGEFERNDMVEYFGEQLSGFAFSRNGWVQSYGSRCVKPPIIHSDVDRPHAMTVDTIRYAQSLTKKPVKGMLTGPVTMLNWSFAREDLPRPEIAFQIARALRKEVLDLEAAGTGIIQVDEAAFKEGYPLRAEARADYEDWAVKAFLLCTTGVLPKTQIHTHMCYSEFADIAATLKAMDADVMSIETSRGGADLLDVFADADYLGDLGPGVYDIHSPRVPDVEEIRSALERRIARTDVRRLWVNPDCGLKTRNWDEVRPALEAMVTATKAIRRKLAGA